MTPLVIIGAGGFGRECHDIVVAMNEDRQQWDFLGFIDDMEPDPALLARRDTEWVGTTANLQRFAGASFIVGVGDSRIREDLVARVERAGLVAAVLIHPSATLGLDVVVGQGSVVCGHASLSTNIRVGSHVHVDQHASIGHDSNLGDYSRVSPGAAVSGNVTLGRAVFIGTNAAVLQGISVGDRAVVGAGAVVIRPVGPRRTVAGVPAREID